MDGLKFWLIVLNVICLLTLLTVMRLSNDTYSARSSGAAARLSGEELPSVAIKQFSHPATASPDVPLQHGAPPETATEAIKIASKVQVKHQQHNTSLPHSGHARMVPEAGVKVEYYNIPGTSASMPSKLHKLHWTSLYGKRENDSYHFFSAYYDNRKGSHRPAVIVMGYIYKTVPDVKFYCVFKDSSGSKHCLKEAAYRQHPSGCFGPVLKAKLFHFFCDVSAGEDPPVSIQMSTSNSCDPNLFSGEIPVRNRKTSMTQKPPKKFGICVGGPLIQESKSLLRDVVEFIEMSKLMGVELIVFYVNETQVDIEVLQHIWTHYPDTVRTIGWKKYKKWYPMHYFGQLLIISDCFQRVMYEVDQVAMIDLDEMIIPLKHNNWPDMVASLKQNPTVTALKFENAFFTEPSPPQQNPPSFCPDVPLPKYFSRTKHYKCFPGYNYRPKIMSRARYILEPNIHYTCKTVSGYGGKYNVPSSIAMLGHYRTTVPNDCAHKPTTSDKTALRFLERLKGQMCPP